MSDLTEQIAELAREVLERCEANDTLLAVAESVTGGLIASSLVDIPGASKVFLGSVVAYNSQLKTSLLGVNQGLIESYSAVDASVAAQMALGVQASFRAGLGNPEPKVIAVSTTGNAGPAANQLHPVGKVFIALADEKYHDVAEVYEFDFVGDRAAVRQQAVYYALLKIREHFSI